MISCCIMGGLGNQLFQVFTCISFAISNKTSFEFNITEKPRGNTHRNTYWLTLFRPLYPHFIIYPNSSILVKELSYTYHPICIPNKEEEEEKQKQDQRYTLFGYFQSYKYFDSNKEAIFHIIQLNQSKQKVLEKMNLDVNVFSNHFVSIHFRLGDYKKLQDSHPVLPTQYYANSLDYLQSIVPDFSTIPIIYFYEKTDEEEVLTTIHTLKRSYRNKFIPVSHELKDWEQVLFMSQCKYNIIANSTFSWWGAYFNTCPNRIVCYPATWFGPAISHDTKDLFLEDWVKIHC